MSELSARHGGEKYKDIQCITEYPGFSSVCLDIDVLDTAYNQYKQEHGVLSRCFRTHRFVYIDVIIYFLDIYLG